MGAPWFVHIHTNGETTSMPLPVPRSLYKYVTAARVADIYSRKIRFTQLRCLNDFWEGKALVHAVIDRDAMRSALGKVRQGTLEERVVSLGEFCRARGEYARVAARG
jgi:hypothetical protein